MENLKQKLISLAYIMLCLAGLLYQVSLICAEYFKYGVSSSTTLTQANDYILPAQSTCFEFPEIFNFTQFNIKYNMNYIYDTTNREVWDSSAHEIQRLASVEDVHEFTPDAETMCDFVNIRNSSSYEWHGHEADECRKHFDVEKFVISSLVCYKISLKDGESDIYNRQNAYFTPNAHGNIYFLFFNEQKFAHFDYIINVMHPVDKYPWFEFSLTQLLGRGHNVSKNTNILNMFNSRSFSISMNKLLPPFKTKCRDYSVIGYHDSFHCLSDCINAKVRSSFGKASLSYHYFKSDISNLKFLSRKDFAKESFNATYRNILNICDRKCPIDDCKFTATYTTTIGEAFVAPGVSAQLPDKPSFEISFGVTILFIDTVNFICSALGVWFGFSFMSIAPDKIFHLRNKKKSSSISALTQNRDSDIAVLKTRFERELLKNKAMRNAIEGNQRQIVLLNRAIKAILRK